MIMLNIISEESENLRGRIVVVGVEGVDGDDDLGNGARGVGGRSAEGARDEGRALHQPHCSLRLRRVHVTIAVRVRVHVFTITTTLVFHRTEKQDNEERASLVASNS